MPGKVSGSTGAQAVQTVQQQDPLANAGHPVGLAGHQLAVAQARTPRNPILKAIQYVGNLFARRLTPVAPPQVQGVTGEIRSGHGAVGTDFLAAMKRLQERPLTENERAQTLLPSGRLISNQFVLDALRDFQVNLPDGQPMMDRTNWDHLSHQEKLGRISDGFEKLIAVCGGDEAKARAYTNVMHQAMASGFFSACANSADNPIRLSDGTPVIPLQSQNQSKSVSLRFSESGNLVMRYDYQSEGLSSCSSQLSGDVVAVNPATSRLSFSYESTLTPDNALELVGVPTFSYELQDAQQILDCIDEAIDGIIKNASPQSVEALLLSLEQADARLSAQGGDTGSHYDALLKTVIHSLEDERVAALIKALNGDVVGQVQGRLAGHPVAERWLMQVEQSAQQILQERSLIETSGIIQKAVSAIESSAPASRIGSLMKTSFQPTANLFSVVRNAGGSFALSEAEELAEQAIAVQSCLSELTTDKLDRLLQATETRDLRRLALAGPQGAVAQALSNEIAARTARLTELVHAGAAELLSHDPRNAAEDPTGPLQDPVGFAQSVSQFAQDLKSLREHCACHGQDFPAATNEILASVLDHSEELLRPDNLLLGELSNQRLGSFAATLKELGIERATASLEAETRRRLAPLETAYQEACVQAFQGLIANNPEQILSGLKAMEETFRTLKETRNDVCLDMGGAPEIALLREDLTRGVLAQMDDGQAMQLFAALQNPDNKALLEGIFEASEAANRAHEDNGLGRQLNTMGAYLDESVGLVATALTQRGISIPRNEESGRLIMPSSGERYSAKQTNAATRQAIHSLFSVDIEPSGKARLTRGAVDRQFRASIAQIQESPISAHEQSLVALPFGHTVGAQFFRDAMRKTDFRLPDGSALIDYSDWGGLTEEQKQERVEEGFLALTSLFDDSDGKAEDHARALTLISHQGLCAGFLGACVQNSEHNPIRLPDGRPVIINSDPGDGSHLSQRISFKRSESGVVSVQNEYAIDHVAHAIRAPGMQDVWLDPAVSRLSFSLEVTQAADGHAIISGSPAYDFRLDVSAWQKPYPRPTAADVRNLALPFQDDFLEFAQSRQSDENLLAQRAINAFRAQPTLSAAQGIVSEFIGEGAPAQVNSSEATLAPIVGAVRQHAQALAAAFAPAVQEVDRMIEGNFYHPPLDGLPGWPVGYPTPLSYASLLGGGNQQAIDAFHAFISDPLRAPEIIAFKNALAELSANPTLERAQQLFDAITAEGSETQINLSSVQSQQIRQAIQGAIQLPPALFDQLDTELVSLISADILPRFVAEVESARP